MTKPLIIGTPLSLAATKVMLLGSGELGKEVIIALQRLGIECARSSGGAPRACSQYGGWRRIA